MKKKVALLLTIVLLVTMFIPVGVAEMAQPYAGQTLRVVLGNHAWTTSLKPYIPEFEEATGIRVVLEEYEINQMTE